MSILQIIKTCYKWSDGGFSKVKEFLVKFSFFLNMYPILALFITHFLAMKYVKISFSHNELYECSNINLHIYNFIIHYKYSLQENARLIINFSD